MIIMQKLILLIALILAFGDTNNTFKKNEHKRKIKEHNIIDELYRSNQVAPQYLLILAKINGKVS